MSDDAGLIPKLKLKGEPVASGMADLGASNSLYKGFTPNGELEYRPADLGASNSIDE